MYTPMIFCRCCKGMGCIFYDFLLVSQEDVPFQEQVYVLKGINLLYDGQIIQFKT